MIGGEQDQRLIQLSAFLQIIQHSADLIIDKGNARIVICLQDPDQIVIQTVIAIFVSVLDPVHIGLQSLRMIRNIGQRHQSRAVQLMPWIRRRKWRMRMNKAAEQIPGRVPGLFLPDKVDGPIGNPGRRMQPLRQLGRLRNIVHFAPDPVRLADIIVMLIPKHFEIRLIPILAGNILFLPFTAHKAAKRIRIRCKMTFPDPMRVVARFRKTFHEGGSIIHRHTGVFIASRMQGILAVNHGTARGHADRAGRVSVCKRDAFPENTIQIRSLNDRIIQCVNGIKSLLVHKKMEYVWSRHP